MTITDETVEAVDTSVPPARAWRALATRFGGTDALADELYEMITGSYGADGRHYHTLDHVLEMLSVARQLGEVAPEVEAAIWLHDVVYRPGSSSNEERSVNLAASWLDALGWPPESIDEVERLILLSRRHDPEPGDENGSLFSDVDLSVLAREPHRYRRYVDDVAREYRHLPRNEWREGRSAFVRSLLARPALFHTPEGVLRFEAAARENLRAELEGRLPDPAPAVVTPKNGEGEPEAAPVTVEVVEAPATAGKKKEKSPAKGRSATKSGAKRSSKKKEESVADEPKGEAPHDAEGPTSNDEAAAEEPTPAKRKPARRGGGKKRGGSKKS